MDKILLHICRICLQSFHLSVLMVQVILNDTKKEKKVESPKDNSIVATGFVAKLGTFQPICDFCVTTKNSDWIIDTCATKHMTCDKNMFTQFSSNSFVSIIINVNGVSFSFIGSGTISISNVLFIPSLLQTLLC